ncbi:MAG TPA: FN3 domain-containing metallophosphoesterase family protein [Candidatus Acidoferrum sp.]|nr:FN3 domain-containing metallophosphoesterase family protein [Candidatus Acidoferrum sp.]
MQRRHFLGALAVSGLGQTLAQGAPAEQKPSLVRTPLVLMAPRAEGIDAVWAVSRLSRGRIEWETEGAKGFAAADLFGFVPQGEKVLRVRLSGLKPGTAYRVRSHTFEAGETEAVVSEWKSFRTLDPAAATAHFAMWNDTHVHNDTLRALHEATPAVDFLVWDGDTCNDWNKEELMAPTLLHPGERDITVKRPLVIVWGNHDSRGPYAFKMPGMVTTPTGRPFYAFRAGPVAVICLHTGEDKPDDHPSFQGRVAFDVLRAEQARWLAQTIRQPEMREAPYRLVFCHIPLRWTDEGPQDYSTTGYDRYSGRSRAAWHDWLVQWKTQVVISGHTHKAAWLPPTTGFPYGQLVGGGPKLQEATWMEGLADVSRLQLRLHNLEGSIVQDITLSPLA